MSSPSSLPLPLSLLLCILLLFLSTHIIHSLKLLVADVFSVSAFFLLLLLLHISVLCSLCALYSVYKTIISNCGVHSRTLSEPWARFTVRHRHPWSFLLFFSFIAAVFSSLLLSASSMSVISYFVPKVVSRLAWLAVCVSGLALAR